MIIMRTKKLFILLFLVVSSAFLVSCDAFIFTNRTSTITEFHLTTLPIPDNGTITFYEEDYADFPIYISPTYSIDNIDEYNDVLLNTKEYVRHANITVQSTLYEMRYPYPWSETLKEYVVGSSSGSGFVFLEKDGYYYAITNFHVVNPSEYSARYSIKTYSDIYSSEAELIAYSEDYDLAVLKFETLDRDDVTVIDIYERLYYKFNIGEMVLAVGNPLGVTNNVTFGTFNGMESIDNTEFKVIYHDASIREGSSGGALVDVDGNLLGVNTWGIDATDDYSFAVPNYIVYTFLINNGVLD